MTKLEKDYKKALEALKFISRNDVSFNREGYAAEVYAELTAKEYEVMKRFICPKCEKVYGWQEDCCGVETVDFSYTRPIEEKEEVWEGKIVTSDGHWLKIYLDGARNGYEDSRVEVRRLKGE